MEGATMPAAPPITRLRSSSGSRVPGFEKVYVRHVALSSSLNGTKPGTRSYMMPKPPRTNARRLPVTSHENESRGERLFRSSLRSLRFSRPLSSGRELIAVSLAHGTVKSLFMVWMSAS